MLFRKCHPEHVLLIQAQARQQLEFTTSMTAALSLADCGEAYSGWHNNRCLAAGGVMPKWRGVATSWMLLSQACGPHMLAIARKTMAVVRNSGYRRVEMYAPSDDEDAHRWARRLGFKIEAERMKAFDPDGRDMALYAYVR